MKKLIGIYTSPRAHWVGDGFPVRTLFSYDTLGKHISPFLLLDHAGPVDFTPTAQRRGVGQHPHRGFETVTIVYDGEVEHRDGVMEMVQLWVNLPAKDKMADAGYQTLVDGDIPVLPLANDAGQLRLIAGEFAGTQGPARTFTPIDVWDLRLKAGKAVTLDLHAGRNTALVILRGTVLVNGEEVARQGQLALFERDGSQLSLASNDDAKVLLLSGEPIDEPIVGHGPFVMNTEQEIHQAFADFQSGRFGQM